MVGSWFVGGPCQNVGVVLWVVPVEMWVWFVGGSCRSGCGLLAVSANR